MVSLNYHTSEMDGYNEFLILDKQSIS